MSSTLADATVVAWLQVTSSMDLPSIRTFFRVVQASFAATWPTSLYIPCQQDIFHRTVSMIVINAFSERHLQPL